MSKPADIPQRVWDEAKRTLGGHLYGNVSSDEAVARAILAAEQREREKATGKLTWAANTHPDPKKAALLHEWAEELRNRGSENG